jgi:glyoxylase-like metal-dependent hydrolase (beta-lactamase superfamily II)
MEDVWQVFAAKYAERNTRTRRESFIVDDDHASPHDMDYFVWVLRNGERTILVDTGYDSAEGQRRQRPNLREPAEAVAALGIDPLAIEDVVVTHMHYDHAGGLTQFPRARIHIQPSEMAFVTGPCMCHDHLKYPFSAEHACEVVRRLFDGRVTFHEGDSVLAPGVSLHRIGGHTAGLQVVRVKTEAGWLCLASDASHYYENFLKMKPFPIVLNLAAMLDGFKRIQVLADRPSLVVPGHDPLMFQNFATPQGAPDFVLRLDQGPRREIDPGNL